MKDILKLVKSPENSGLLLDGVSETLKNEPKEKKGAFLSMLLCILGTSLLGNMMTRNGFIRAGDKTIRAGYGSKRSLLKKS